MWKWLKWLFREDRAQDIVEYALLIGFVAFAAAGLMSLTGNGLKGVWTGANSTIAAANPVRPPTHPHNDND